MELRTHAGSAMSSGLVAGWKMWNECEQPPAKMATVCHIILFPNSGV